MQKKEDRSMEKLNDNVLTAVGGGGSLYEDTTGVDKESWFVSIIKKLMVNGGNAGTAPPKDGK